MAQPKKKLAHDHKCQVGYHVWTCEDAQCLGDPIGTRKPSKTYTCPSCSATLHGEAKHHESYGLLSIGRFQANHTRFFGSSVIHSGGIHLTIQTATKARSLNENRYHSDKNLIRVRLSPAQFADLITSPNSPGVPCTIEWFGGKRMNEPPEVAVRAQFTNEFEEKVTGAFVMLEKVTRDIEDYFKTGKGSRVDIRDKLATVRRELSANAPFILSQFNRGMDKIVTEAKSEVESFVEGKIRSLGIGALSEDIKAAIEAPLESAPLQLLSKDEEIEEDAT